MPDRVRAAFTPHHRAASSTAPVPIPSACYRCAGSGIIARRIFPDCTISRCVEHLSHFDLARCFLCRGSGRADILTIAYRRCRRAVITLVGALRRG